MFKEGIKPIVNVEDLKEYAQTETNDKISEILSLVIIKKEERKEKFKDGYDFEKGVLSKFLKISESNDIFRKIDEDLEFREYKSIPKYVLNDLLDGLTGKSNVLSEKNMYGEVVSSGNSLGVRGDIVSAKDKEEMMVKSAIIFLMKYDTENFKTAKDIELDCKDFSKDKLNGIVQECRNIIKDYMPDAFEDGGINYKKLNREYLKLIEEKDFSANNQRDNIKKLVEENPDYDVLIEIVENFDRKEIYKFGSDRKSIKAVDEELQEKLSSNEKEKEKMSYINVLAVLGKMVDSNMVERHKVNLYLRKLKELNPLFKDDDPMKYLYGDVEEENMMITTDKLFNARLKGFNKWSGGIKETTKNEEVTPFEKTAILKDILSFVVYNEQINNRSSYSDETYKRAISVSEALFPDLIVDGKIDKYKALEKINYYADEAYKTENKRMSKVESKRALYKYNSPEEVYEDRMKTLSRDYLRSLLDAENTHNKEVINYFGNTYSDGQAKISSIINQKRKENRDLSLVTGCNDILKSFFEKPKGEDGKVHFTPEEKTMLLEASIVIAGIEGNSDFRTIGGAKSEEAQRQKEEILANRYKTPEDKLRLEAMKRAEVVLQKFFPKENLVSPTDKIVNFEKIEEIYRRIREGLSDSVLEGVELDSNRSVVSALTRQFYQIVDNEQEKESDERISDSEIARFFREKGEELGVSEDKREIEDEEGVKIYRSKKTRATEEKHVEIKLDEDIELVDDIEVADDIEDSRKIDSEDNGRGAKLTEESKVESSSSNIKAESISFDGDTEYSGPVQEGKQIGKKDNPIVSFFKNMANSIKNRVSSLVNRKKEEEIEEGTSIEEVRKENQIIENRGMDDPLQRLEGFRFDKNYHSNSSNNGDRSQQETERDDL